MNPRNKTLLWVAAGVMAGVALVMGVRQLGGKSATAVLAQPQATAPAMVVDGKPVEATADQDVLPWDQPGGAAGAAISRSQNALSVNAVPSPEQNRRSIAAIRQQSDQNLRQVDTLLQQLDEVEKLASVPAQVQLNALRNNLLVAKRTQLLAVEMAELTQQPDTPARKARNEAIIAELQRLKSQLVLDVAALPAAAMPAANGANAVPRAIPGKVQ